MWMTDFRQLALENIDHIEEEDDRCAQEPPGVDDTLEQN